MTAAYDSREDTLVHIEQVRAFMGQVICDLEDRAIVHDRSKLSEPEKSVFDEHTPLLRDMAYGSDEYNASLAGMGEGLKHHYAANDHHPEHFEGEPFERGIHAMGLHHLVEMLCDWKAATLRHANGDLARSIEQNAERFGYGDEMKRLLMNTAQAFGWLDEALVHPDDSPFSVPQGSGRPDG